MKVFMEVIKLNFKVMFQYKWTFAMTVIIQPILLLINMSLFKSIYAYNDTTSIKGYGFEQMVWYYTAYYVILSFVWNGITHQISRKILSGQLATDLLKPISVFRFMLAGAISSRIVAMLVDFLPGMLIYSLILFPSFMTVQSFFSFVLIALLAFVLNYMFSFLLGMSAMIIKNNMSINAIREVLQAIVGGGLIPLEFMPVWLNRIFDFLPFKYIIYWPIQFFLNRVEGNRLEMLLRVGFLQIVWIIVFYAAIQILWKSLIKKFCAAGG
ncbi:hypothetical protein CLHUN_11350 [Ruminiclostridium hungatei]|uniref:ABC-2 family transporter protein n=1 Tax=Ruminiclostridium hungatei TaxID=48256 RepID=A0A1V4SMY1_RUMHU|nr:ABC-2 family transporter protein [Ruminiclostridium hungatei]OPX45248.1 hypothetical protein CLHUN_11350 [Ruminiclostridium hungatei]